jgi:hypothetical protein
MRGTARAVFPSFLSPPFATRIETAHIDTSSQSSSCRYSSFAAQPKERQRKAQLRPIRRRRRRRRPRPAAKGCSATTGDRCDTCISSIRSAESGEFIKTLLLDEGARVTIFLNTSSKSETEADEDDIGTQHIPNRNSHSRACGKLGSVAAGDRNRAKDDLPDCPIFLSFFSF